MLKTIWVIAKNTFRETIRDKILYSLIAFAVLVIAASLLAASVSLDQDVRVIKNFSLTATLTFLLLITIFIGTQLVYREVERKTVNLVLTKPISRESFYLGKFFGLCLTITVACLIMAVMTGGLLFFKTRSMGEEMLWAILFILLEAYLVTALGMFFSSFAAPISSAVYTFCLVLIGHSSSTLWSIAQKSQAFLKYLIEGVYYIFPNLEKFNLRNEVVFGFSPEQGQIIAVVAYFAGYTLALLLLGMAALRRHEF